MCLSKYFKVSFCVKAIRPLEALCSRSLNHLCFFPLRENICMVSCYLLEPFFCIHLWRVPGRVPQWLLFRYQIFISFNHSKSGIFIDIFFSNSSRNLPTPVWFFYCFCINLIMPKSSYPFERPKTITALFIPCIA